MRNLMTGLKTLEGEEEFWDNEVKKRATREAVARHRNATRALGEFKSAYRSQLDQIEKYPFLAK